MRVITGSARGRRLHTLEGEAVRPTTDKVKEALFSIIQFDIEGRHILDLFAGSGQLGIEALSRGAESCCFVDSSKNSLDVVEENLRTTGLKASAALIRSDSLSFLSSCREKYDVVFIDPPYKSGLAEKVLLNIQSHLNAGAVVICETSSETVLPEFIGELAVKTYKYGKTLLYVYR